MTWNPPAWTLTGERGANQKTPNLAAQLNAAIATNWQSFSLSFILQGNALTNDVLNARSYEFAPTHAGAPELFVEYTVPNTGGGGTNMANLRNIFINEVAPKGTTGFPEDWIELGNDGVINPFAKLYSNRLQLNIGANTVVARVLFNGEFGPKTMATYNNSAVLPLAFRLKNVDNQIFMLSPNPANESVGVDLTHANGLPVELTIYNNFGQPLLKQSVERAHGMHHLLLDGLESGAYIVEIRAEGQRTIGRKLIVNR